MQRLDDPPLAGASHTMHRRKEIGRDRADTLDGITTPGALSALGR